MSDLFIIAFGFIVGIPMTAGLAYLLRDRQS